MKKLNDMVPGRKNEDAGVFFRIAISFLPSFYIFLII